MSNIRVQFEIPAKKMEDLEILMEKCGIATRKSLFNNALSLLEWVVQEVENGNIIASIDEDKNKIEQLMMPAIMTVGSE